MNKRALLVDNSDSDIKAIKNILEKYNFYVDVVNDGESARNKIWDENYDIVISELVLPKLDGLNLCKKIRSFTTCPIIIVSEKIDVESRILALDNGADDYLTKPFNIGELRARINAILRRADPNKNFFEKSIINIEKMCINTLGRIVNVEDKEVNLTAKEFDLLMLLAMHRGKIYSRERLLEEIWGYEHFADVRTVDVHVRRLREKIETIPSKPEYIITKWGSGYFFKSDNELARKSELLQED